MKYYSSWQVALADFILRWGHEYEDSFSLISEFEQMLNVNSKGAFFLLK